MQWDGKLVSILLFLLFVFLYPVPLTLYPALAHTLKTDGSIGAIFHTDPDDDVIAGQPTQIFFDFKDTQNKFQLSDCNCIVTIYTNNQKLADVPITTEGNDEQVGYGNYTFNSEGDYQVKITGTPKTTDSFQQFNLSYDLHVQKFAPQASVNPNQNWFLTHKIHLVAVGIVALFLLLALSRQKFYSSKNVK